MYMVVKWVEQRSINISCMVLHMHGITYAWYYICIVLYVRINLLNMRINSNIPTYLFSMQTKRSYYLLRTGANSLWAVCKLDNR